MQCVGCDLYNAIIDICLAGGDTSNPDKDIYCREAGINEKIIKGFLMKGD